VGDPKDHSSSQIIEKLAVSSERKKWAVGRRREKSGSEQWAVGRRTCLSRLETTAVPAAHDSSDTAHCLLLTAH